VVVWSYKVRIDSRLISSNVIDAACVIVPANESCSSTFIMTSKCNVITLHTASTPATPYNLRVISCTASSIQLSWAAPDDSSVDVLGTITSFIVSQDRLEFRLSERTDVLAFFAWPQCKTLHPVTQQSWWRSIVVRTSVLAGGLSLSCARLMDGCLTTLWVRRPLSVNQQGQLSLPSLRGRLNE